MHFSITTLLSSILMGIPLLLLLTYIQKNLNKHSLLTSKALNIIIILFILRLLLPFEFPYTITLPSFFIFTSIMDVLNLNIPIINIQIVHFLIVIIIIGAIYKLNRFIADYYALNQFTKSLSNSNSQKIIHKNNKTIQVISSPLVCTPCLIGLIKPKILIPKASYTDREIDYIIKHELIHIHRSDILLNYLFAIIKIIYWWNPIVHIFHSRFSQVIELCVDDNIISNMTESEKVLYAEVLLKSAQNDIKYQPNNLLSVNFTYQNNASHLLLERTKNILSQNKQRMNTLQATLFSILCLLSITLFAVEPFYTRTIEEDGAVIINRFNSYILYDGSNYTLFVNNKEFGKINDPSTTPDFKDLPIKYEREK